MKFRITITKDVIDRSLMCGVGTCRFITESCAFAIAYNDLIPKVHVGLATACFYKQDGHLIDEIDLTSKQTRFISKFDALKDKPQQRFSLVGRRFNVEIPDSVIEYWYQDAAVAAQKIADSSCLTLLV